MPILTEDIKLLKSAVMADVPEGGGAMTGNAVIDGQSNNLFPDTSAMDRAFGRVNIIKMFGVAHTDDTATLMGAHAIITQAPADPLVQCTLLKTANWADTRSVAQSGIEKYLVKGPKLSYRLYDTHYAGSLQIRLISMVGGTPPAGGAAIVLRNPNGQEQYVRILRVALATQTVAVVEGSTVLVAASVATCDIGNPLDVDFLGPPALRVGLVEANYCQVYDTNIAGGARFYGIKPLASAAAPGDYSVLAAGGIYTPVVPAATVESPLIDLHPLQALGGLSPTALGTLTLLPQTVALAAGTRLTTPTPIAPGSVSLAGGGNTFVDDRTGNLLLGTLVVGTVDYRARTIAFATSSPNYGTVSTTLSYAPATVAPLTNHSAYFPVTSANQGLAYTNAFGPAPAPGTFGLSYMAQGRWYDLSDNLNGKLSGLDSSYGTGTIDYTTGSMGVTLGAIPDIGSALIAQWGEKAAASGIDASRLPTRLGTRLPINDAAMGSDIQLAWSRAGINYTATVGATGQVSGDATGSYGGRTLLFEPNVFPDGAITVTTKRLATRTETVTTPANYTYDADTAVLPIIPGTFTGKLNVSYPTGTRWVWPTLDVFDRDGIVYARYHGNKEDGIANNGSQVAVGTLDYTTGRVVLNPSPPLFLWVANTAVNSTQWVREVYTWMSLVSTTLTIAPTGALTAPAFYSGSTTTTVETAYVASDVQTVGATTWTAAISTGGPALVLDATAFKLGGENYTASGGVLRKAWNMATGAPLVASAGSLGSDGVLTVNTLPANFTNGITWVNAAQNASTQEILGGVFRTASAPLKTGVMQLLAGANVGNANEAGDLSGGGFSGSADFQRGIVKWSHTTQINGATLSYNAVFLQYLPLDKTLLGIDTVRLPLDGKVPIYRSGDLLVVHNTLTAQLPTPLVKGTAYSLGRERLASVRVKDALGVLVPSSKYVSDLNPGLITVSVGADITMYTQPLSVEHRIEDMMVCSQADISGRLKFTRDLTHAFPANTSFVSSALPFGDLFSRAYNYIEQTTWTGVWSDALIGAAPLANFNEGQYPVVTTNRGAITERWALIFTSATAFRIVGESVGDIGTGNTATDCAPINPATGAPYFTLPALGWGNGWAVGNVLRKNTAACGAPLWAVRTVLQGPATLDSDVFSIAFRGDVDRP